MKPTSLYVLLVVALLSWMGCEDDDPTTATLSYDGPNVTAPLVAPGRTVFAAFFPAGETEQFQGRELERVRFWLSGIPAATEVIVYGEGPDPRTPGPELYRRDVSARVSAIGWYEERLLPGIEITGEGLWLTVATTLDGGAGQTVGCDAGRNFNPNGALLLNPNATQWASFDELTGERVNWNIQGVVSQE